MSRLVAEVVYRWRYPLSIAILAGAIASIPSANVTEIDNDITSWFSREDPVYQDYERFREEFGGTRSLIVALKADSPDRVFSDETLRFIVEVSDEIERVETVQRVSSLATATIVESTHDGGLDVRPLLDRLGDVPPAAIRRRALQDDLIRGDLVSEDGAVTAIVVGFDEDRIDEVRAGVIQQIHDVVDPKLPEGLRAYYNGSLEISETYNRVTLDNQRKFTPPILLLTIAALFLTFRSWRKTLLSMVAIGVSILWTLGLYALMGFTYNVLSSMIVPLIVVLAIADDVHILQHWDEARRQGSAEHAFKATLRHLTAPLLGASATTALGMLSLATSDVVAVRSFGIGAAVGIMVDFVVSIVLMPTMLSLVKAETSEAPHERYLLRPLQKVAGISCRHPGRVAAISVGLGAIAALGILQLRVDTNHINFFGRGHPLRESAAVIDASLSGVYSFEIMLEGPPESLKTPDALQRMDRLENELRAFPNVRKVTSVADYVKRINKELNDGRESANVVPDDANTIAQELFVFALGGEGRHELERVVASDYSRAQIGIKLRSMSSELVLDEVERAEHLATRAFEGTGISVLATGSGRLFGTLDRYLVDSQVSSFGTAFLTVFGVIFIVFRSLRFGLLAIVPNLLPVLAVLGVMGYLGISLNIATVMVASVALGVVDDDTIHFINRYRVETGRGATTDEAIQTATLHEGRASLTTVIINSCGFGVLLLSEYKPTAWFGGLLALTMAVAFLAEVFILPALIKLLPGFFGEHVLKGRREKEEGRKLTRIAGLVVSACVIPAPALAQGLDGHVSLFADYLPNREHTAELRARVFAEQVFDPTPRLVLTFSGFAEGLLARRPANSLRFEPGLAGDAVLRAQEATVDYSRERFAVLAGYERVVWGRLDELQPTDVVNPLDVSRFFFEGRSEARLPVALVRGRLFLGGDTTLEAVYVPLFRRGRFDELDEATSPFNLETDATRDVAVCQAIGCPTLPLTVDVREPRGTWGNPQGGLRFSSTAGRLDWSVSAYRGFEPFGLYERPSAELVALYQELLALGLQPPELPAFVSVFPRFTMVGADFETVKGEWGLRGEAAAFVDDNFQGPGPGIVEGESFDAGVGVDRRAGQYRVSGTVLVHRESHAAGRRTDVTFVASADRTFARERYRVRTFAVANPSEGSGFLRAIATMSLRDDLALESSGGWFIGDGRDTVGRFGDRDFVYLRLTAFF